jgi:hypothetical protein
MFGYLNVLLATAVLRAGGSVEEGLAALVESNAAAIGFGAEALEWGRFRFDAKELADLRARTLGGFGSCPMREPVNELGGCWGVWERPVWTDSPCRTFAAASARPDHS